MTHPERPPERSASRATRGILLATALLIGAVPALASATEIGDTVVTFNEVHYHPAPGSGETEWFELHNQMAFRVDLSGWTIAGEVAYRFPEGSVIEPREFVVVALDPAHAGLAGVRTFGPFEGRLDNSGGEIRLLDRHGRVMDAVEYDDSEPWPAAADGAGATLSKRTVSASSQTTENWRASIEPGGTPGRRNFARERPPSIQQLVGRATAWRFANGETPPGDGWMDPSFDDASWPQSSAPFVSGLVLNDGFESEVFTVSPGRISQNGAITGWMAVAGGAPGADADGSAGLNGGTLATFANNGRVPDGRNVAFLRYGGDQAIGLSQIVEGLSPGLAYVLHLRENGRATSLFPSLAATLDGGTVLASHLVPNVDPSGTFESPYRRAVSRPFIATGPSADLTITNAPTGLPFGADLVIDQVALVRLRFHDDFGAGAPEAPIDGRVPDQRPDGSETTWTTAASDGLVVRNGRLESVVDAPTNALLAWPTGAAPGTAMAGAAFGGTGGARAVGFTASASGSGLTTGGVVWAELEPNGRVILHAAPDGGANPVGVAAPDEAGFPFDVGGVNHLALAWDRFGGTASVRVNDHEALHEIALGEDFAPPVGAVGVSLSGIGSSADGFFAAEIPARATTLPPASTAPTRYFRRFFTFLEDAAKARAQLTARLQDGGIIYLNGTEILRHNLPEGPLDHDTRALASSFAAAPLTATIPPGILATGSNLLAVAVHSAEGSAETVFEASVAAIIPDEDGDDSPVDAPPTVAINELAAASAGGSFFVELANTGFLDVDLAEFSLRLVAGETVTEIALSGSLPAGDLAAIHPDDPLLAPGPGDRLVLASSESGHLLDAAVVRNRVRGRRPDGTGRWENPSAPTPGAPNQFDVVEDVVINEILYHHHPEFPDPGADIPYREIDEEWIELHNRGSQPVDLSGWRLDDAVTHDFPEGTTIGPGAYLVVASDPAALAAKVPGIRILGPFDGGLSNRSERIALVDARGNVADEVTYHDGAPWPEFADGGGGSLELRDPFADNDVPASWAASDSGRGSEWRTYRYRGTAPEPPRSNNPRVFHEFLLGLLESGEILLDDLSVVEDPDNRRIEFIQNGDFEADLVGATPATWRILGTHRESRVVRDPDGPGKVLHLVSDGQLEHSYNLASTTFADNERVFDNQTYEISFRAKWLAGSPQLNTRLYFNRLAKTHVLPQPALTGTPGAANSTRVPSAGPGLRRLQHAPVVPQPSEPFLVSVDSPDAGATAVTLHWASGSRPWEATAMARDEGGTFRAIVPGQPDREIVRFFIEAVDDRGGHALLPAGGAARPAFCRIGDGRVGARRTHTMRIIMDPAEAEFLHTDIHTPSNFRFNATVISDDEEVFHNCGVRLRGSPYGRRGARAGWNLRFPRDQLFRGLHRTVAVDGGFSIPNGEGNGFLQVGPGIATNELVYNQIAHRAGGVPATHDDAVYVDAPRSVDSKYAQLKMTRFEDPFLATTWENGADGTVFKQELIYHPTSTVDGDPESLKGVYNAVLQIDLVDMGDSRDAYRLNYLIRNHTDRDDFDPIIAMSRAMSAPSANLREATDAVLDVDQWMRVFAMQHLAGMADTYNQSLAHNLEFYVRPSDGRILVFPWDLDHGFYYSPTSSLYGNGIHRVNAVIRTIPQNRRRYLGHLLDLCRNGFDPAYIADWVTHFNDVSSQPAAGGYTNWIRRRRDFVLARLDLEIPPVPFAITTNGGQDFSTSDPAVFLEGTGWIDVRGILRAASGARLDIEWLDETRWRVAVPLGPGANPITLAAIDHQGAEINTATINVTNTGPIAAASKDNLVVSELMYHPPAPSEAEIAAGFTDQDDFEFLELLNIGDAIVDLRRVRFIAGITFDFDTGADTLTLAAGRRLVLAANRAAFEFRYGAGHPVVGEYPDTRLDNGGETVTLVDAGGGPIKDFRYDDRFPWPEAADGDGWSLVLVRPESNPDHANPASWRVGSTAGGSPGGDDRQSLDEWMTANGWTDPERDDNGNGLPNLLDFALGSDTVSPPGTRVDPVVLRPAGGDPYALVFRYRERLGAEDITYRVEASTALEDWPPAPPDGVTLERLDATPNGDGTLDVTIGVGVPAAVDPARIFLRLEVAAP